MLEIYKKTHRWKIVLLITGIFILVLPIYFANKLAKNLAEREKLKVELFVKLLEELTNSNNLEEDITFELELQTILKEEINVVTVNINGIHQYYNYGINPDTSKIRKRVEASNNFFITNEYPKIYYEYPAIVNWIKYIPWLQLLLLLIYALIGYSVFNLSRREEQNRVWVGMAKETAHQMGTPISGMMGWMEHLKSRSSAGSFTQEEIIKYIEQDIDKLQQVSDRFSKIGSTASLQPESLLNIILEAKDYMKPRASKNITFDFPSEGGQDYQVQVNKNLFSWVLENLLRNALDAMTETGKITVKLYQEADYACVDVSDTGHGISVGKFNTIFKPGFTTKERGWGLGLSLAKRIIENYHNGKIFVKESSLGKGTTITIRLLRA
ncbi:MAG: HAMP domain-containing histidine kinase [Saprospiraceae bacterium]|nr:HAMP domain-containing histidine kinase [Saprospiraceae bacterium]